MGITASIALMPGDGVGPEIVAEATKALDAVAKRFGHRFDTYEIQIGGAAIDAYGVPLRPEDLRRCQEADAVLLGAVGGPKWDTIEVGLRPERGLLALRKGMGLYANLRPVAVYDALADSSPVKAEIVKGVDVMVVRELTGGIYFGRPSRQWRERRGRAAVDTMVYREHEIERVTRLAFELARGRRRKVASVDKANVLATSRLWRDVVTRVAADFPDVELEHVLVDAMSMRLIRQPARFDVVVLENMFGDILTDEASVLAGSIGLLPSASIGAARSGGDQRRRGVYEPIHGSAPHMAGQGRANPTGTIMSLAMLLRLSLGLETEAKAIESAVRATIENSVRTPDIAEPGQSGVSTSRFGDEVASRIATA
ncbi:MAG: 3-isopropylmalate dehydrogenase [Thermomicrobiales bacterium]|nr:3-isopropylmalate dehydrogenase [Thermomicrobiales bacterium]MEA2598228.1 3-isopropylmalate dehydrogenase [Thermomicrobiales bacterium]